MIAKCARCGRRLKDGHWIFSRWTLEELQTIWEFDGDAGQSTVTDVARGMGVSHSNWYSIRARLLQAGSPEALYEQMKESKLHRYNRASNGKVREATNKPDTIADSLARVYGIRVGSAGRGGQYQQFTVTIPSLLARAFVASHGGLQVVWEPTEDGLLLKPAPKTSEPENLPAWLSSNTEGAQHGEKETE